MPDSSHSLTLRFFDLDVSVSSSDLEIIEPFVRLYSAFRVRPDAITTGRSLRFQFTGLTNSEGGGRLLVDDELWPVSAAMCQSGALYEFMLKCIYERIQSHLLIHASAVALNGVGVLFVADSGFGKSTLALSLSLRGAGFLSDEVGAIHRATGRIDGFPRCLRLDRRSLDLAGVAETGRDVTSWFGKLLVDIESIRPGARIRSAPLGAVIFLGHTMEPEASLAASGPTCIEFLVDRFDAALVGFAERLPGLTSVQSFQSEGFTTLRIQGESLGQAAVEIEEYCREHRLCVLDASSPVDRPASFSQRSEIYRVPAKDALRSLAKQFLPGRSSWILRNEFQGQSARLMFEMSRVFGSVKFYRMAVGDVSRMMGLIDEVIGVPQEGRVSSEGLTSVVNP